MILNYKMKYSKLTYYLLAVLCVMATSCVTDGVMDDDIKNIPGEPIKGGKINFALTFPETSPTRGIDGEADDSANERTINDVQIYTFVGDLFVEQVKYVLIGGVNGEITRFVEGKLSGTYDTGTSMDFIVITNVENKGVRNVKMNPGDSKTDLYRQLIFSYGKTADRSTNLPMWGEGTIESIQSGKNNMGELTLKRAVAKVNVTVNDGKGITDFVITEVQVHNYNTQGYSAPIKNDGPSIPDSSTLSTDFLTSGTLSDTEGNRVENKFYIPEHKNKGAEERNKVFLVIKSLARGKVKTYTIPFSENGKDYDVLRNHIYVFNITSVKMDVTLEYEVKAWEIENINVPSFD